ncbi:MAG: hypothetical protein IT451_11420 [Candidatus Brocadia sp.]|nr:hypothetical protein [Candidatus Brocadia sp.]
MKDKVNKLAVGVGCIEHTGTIGTVSKIGIWLLTITFEASFGYTDVARLSLQ